jgi:hypothetical protein
MLSCIGLYLFVGCGAFYYLWFNKESWERDDYISAALLGHAIISGYINILVLLSLAEWYSSRLYNGRQDVLEWTVETCRTLFVLSWLAVVFAIGLQGSEEFAACSMLFQAAGVIALSIYLDEQKESSLA